MIDKMRFENGSNFLEISQALSEPEGIVWIVLSNISPEDLPPAFRVRIKISDEEGFKKLKNAVLIWAERKEYKLVSGNTCRDGST